MKTQTILSQSEMIDRLCHTEPGTIVIYSDTQKGITSEEIMLKDKQCDSRQPLFHFIRKNGNLLSCLHQEIRQGRYTFDFPIEHNVYQKSNKPLIFNDVEVRVFVACYEDNNNLYVGLLSKEDDEEDCWELFTDITVNFQQLPPHYGYIKNQDENEGIADFLIKGGIAVPSYTIPDRQNGFVRFKAFLFNMEKLKQLCPYSYKEYEEHIRGSLNN